MDRDELDIRLIDQLFLRIDVHDVPDAKCMEVLDRVRMNVSIVPDMYSWSENHPKIGPAGIGLFTALAYTCSEGESLIRQVENLREECAPFKVDVRAFDMLEDAGWHRVFKADDPISEDDE